MENARRRGLAPDVVGRRDRPPAAASTGGRGRSVARPTAAPSEPGRPEVGESERIGSVGIVCAQCP